MSLINKMLNDLEKRDAFLHGKHDTVLNGLYSAYDVELEQQKKWNASTLIFLSIFTIIIISATVFFLYLSNEQKNQVFTVKPDITQEKPAKKNTDTNINKNLIANTSKLNNFLRLDDNLKIETSLPVKDNNNYVQLNRIDEIYFDKNDRGINLVIKTPKDIDYLVYGLNNPNRIVVEVNNAELGFLLEKLIPVDPIVAIRYSINAENRFKLVLETDQSLTIRKTTTINDDGFNDLVVAMDYQWQNNFSDKKEDKVLDKVLNDIVDYQVNIESESIYKGEIVKTPVNYNVNAYAEKLFRQGYQDFKNGDISNSLKKLNMALNQDASHVNARSTLATILSKQGHSELAYSILNEGLIQNPEQAEWLKVYARILLDNNKLIDAKKLLEKHSPDLSVNVEYYALKAAILQKLNEHSQSAKIYRDLLQFNPSKSVWWMGLGISLEALKRYQDALYAYQKASNNSSLASDSRKFISQRITSLSNLIKDESS